MLFRNAASASAGFPEAIWNRPTMSHSSGFFGSFATVSSSTFFAFAVSLDAASAKMYSLIAVRSFGFFSTAWAKNSAASFGFPCSFRDSPIFR